MLIRLADAEADADACAAIYAPAVIDGVASLEERAPEPPELADRIRTVSRTHPWLVAELEDEVVGYAYASRHRDRASYRWATDVAVYVSDVHHRRGVGRALYGELLPMLGRQGYYVACAGITLPNEASIRLHESVGFKPVGVYRNIGYKHGAWRDVSWWQAELREPAPGGTPAEPRPL